MKLIEALQIESYKVVTTVGGGGKSSTLLTLAKELSSIQKKYFITTTTRVVAKELAAFQIIYGENFAELHRKIKAALPKTTALALATKLTGSEKILGIPAEWVDRLSELYPDFYFLVEGDGAARKPFKVPGEKEPVIPGSTRLVIGVMGAEIIGDKLLDANVHRAELLSQLASIPLGELLDYNVISQVILSSQGYLKNVPSQSDFALVINKVESPLYFRKAKKLANLLLAKGVGCVVLTALQTEQPVREVFCL